jgi:hypothetical protein
VLTPAGISAAVTAEPGPASETVSRAAEELRVALERSAGKPAAVAVAARGPGEKRPAPTQPPDWVDVRV